MIIKKALSFDDVLIIPQHSTMQSRKNADLTTSIADVPFSVPIISANMSSITGKEMIDAMCGAGGLGILHRFNSIAEMLTDLNTDSHWKGFSFGIDNLWKDRVMRGFDMGASIACLDVAHADNNHVIEIIYKYWDNFFGRPLIVGNIATGIAALRIREATPNACWKNLALKVGIGGGSLCTTRIQTGCGMPTFQSVLDVKHAIGNSVSIVADGGIKNSGDIVKAIGAGANAVMIGSLIAGTDECPTNVIKGQDGNLYKIYRGSASYGDKKYRNEEPKNIEGVETLVPYQGPVSKVINHLTDGIRSGLSYAGYSSINSFVGNAQFVEITSAGMYESKPHRINNLQI